VDGWRFAFITVPADSAPAGEHVANVESGRFPSRERPLFCWVWLGGFGGGAERTPPSENPALPDPRTAELENKPGILPAMPFASLSRPRRRPAKARNRQPTRSRHESAWHHRPDPTSLLQREKDRKRGRIAEARHRLGRSESDAEGCPWRRIRTPTHGCVRPSGLEKRVVRTERRPSVCQFFVV